MAILYYFSRFARKKAHYTPKHVLYQRVPLPKSRFHLKTQYHRHLSLQQRTSSEIKLYPFRQCKATKEPMTEKAVPKMARMNGTAYFPQKVLGTAVSGLSGR